MLKPTRILWIDSDHDSVAKCIKGLTRRGLQVDYARSAADALSLAGRTVYDFAVIELMLPDALGTEVWRTLRKQNDHLSAILTTSAPSLYENIEPSGNGVIAFLLKPFTTQMIAQLVGARNGTGGGKSQLAEAAD
jgi:DNA-binding response OmpR family regulator